ncbi:MAG TPA: RNA 2'-phosphotransferase [Allosphingosinicella sp.]|jgi:putative RNA 2'-phosphotransferase
MADSTRISKSLSYWLRHKPQAGGLTLDRAGWAPVVGVLAALRKAGLPGDAESLFEVIAGSDKNRFELSEDRASVRARQEHSVEVDLDWPAAEPARASVPRHRRTLPRGHLRRGAEADEAAPRPPLARSGDRDSGRSAPREAVILRVASGRMAADGHVFRLSGNGVWLTDGVPPGYLERTDGY